MIFKFRSNYLFGHYNLENSEPADVDVDDASSNSSNQPRTYKKKLKEQTENSEEIAELDDFELIFHPHPELMETSQQAESRYLKTTANATIDHLSQYLSVRMALDKDDSHKAEDSTTFNIYILTNSETEEYQLLERTMHLSEIHEVYWKENKPLELYYAPVTD